MPRKFKEKECEMCEVSYTPTSSKQRYCKECGVKNKKQYDNQWKRQWYRRPGNKEKKREWDRRRNQANPEKVREASKRYRQKNPEKVREASKRYRQKNPEKVKEYEKRYRQENPEKVREANKRWAQANPEKVKERKKRFCQKNPEKVKEYEKRYRQENPEKVRARTRRWRQAKEGQDTACVYSISNKITGQGYIGETIRFEGRVYSHQYNLKAGRHPNSLLQKDYDKYGADAFEFSMVKEINKEDFQSEQELKEYLRVEEAKLVLEEAHAGKELYNLALNPVYIVAVLKERLLGKKE